MSDKRSTLEKKKTTSCVGDRKVLEDFGGVIIETLYLYLQ